MCRRVAMMRGPNAILWLVALSHASTAGGLRTMDTPSEPRLQRSVHDSEWFFVYWPSVSPPSFHVQAALALALSNHANTCSHGASVHIHIHIPLTLLLSIRTCDSLSCPIFRARRVFATQHDALATHTWHPFQSAVTLRCIEYWRQIWNWLTIEYWNRQVRRTLRPGHRHPSHRGLRLRMHMGSG